MMKRLMIMLVAAALVAFMAVMPVLAEPGGTADGKIINRSAITATASGTVVAKGDRVNITGIAEGNPNTVQIWIFGMERTLPPYSEAVHADGSFRHEVRQEQTASLASGQYFVVVQHPGQNNRFEIDTVYRTCGSSTDCFDYWIYNKQLKNTTTGAMTRIFILDNYRGRDGSLHGSDAAEALIRAINDPSVDDSYTELQFDIVEPVIHIDPVGDRHVGDRFIITAQTNLAVDDEVLIQINSSSFPPPQRNQSSQFHGVKGTVKVTGSDNGMNRISFDVDTASFSPDEYMITAEAVIQDPRDTALFNVLCCAAPLETTAPPSLPTARSPGCGALTALIGLGAVAFIVIRKY